MSRNVILYVIILIKIKTSSIKKKFIKKTNNNIINNNTLTQRNIIEPKLRINDEKKRKNIMSNKNINSNRVYNNKVNFLSLECEEKSHLIDSNSIKSPRLGNYRFNQINLNKYNKIRKSNLMNNNNYYTNKNKIKMQKRAQNIKQEMLRKAKEREEEERKLMIKNE